MRSGHAVQQLTGDGHADAFIKEPGPGYRVHTSDGQGAFDETWRHDDASIRYEPWCVAFGDGALDVFVPVYGLTGGPNIVWRNTHND